MAVGGEVVRHVWRNMGYSVMSIVASQYPVMGRGFRRVVDLRKRRSVTFGGSKEPYKGPLEIKSVSGDKIQFWGSSLAGAPTGKLSLFKGGWQVIDGTEVPFETDITVTENTVFYVEGTMTLDVDYHTYSMAYVFKKAAGTFPAPEDKLIEIRPCWYVPVITIGEGEAEQIVIDIANIERWLNVVNVPGIS